jgi:hypothetical protein
MKIINRDELINEIYTQDGVWLEKLLDKEIAERCIPAVVGYAFESYKIYKFESKLYVDKKLCQILFTVSKIAYCEDVEKEIITELNVKILHQHTNI